MSMSLFMCLGIGMFVYLYVYAYVYMCYDMYISVYVHVNLYTNQNLWRGHIPQYWYIDLDFRVQVSLDNFGHFTGRLAS